MDLFLLLVNLLLLDEPELSLLDLFFAKPTTLISLSLCSVVAYLNCLPEAKAGTRSSFTFADVFKLLLDRFSGWALMV